MNCIVTAGPTYEPLDKVRRLTNFSTGRLGTELANYLTAHGHDVTLLIGEQATWAGERRAGKIQVFTTTLDLRRRLKALSKGEVHAVFHVAAVSDFRFGKVWVKAGEGIMKQVVSGKISTRAGLLTAELVPTPKLISDLRGWYPKAKLVGWKYEVDGNREHVIELAKRQLAECRTDLCVANGPGYGLGFGLVCASNSKHFRAKEELFDCLRESARARNVKA
jgi:phosphopantothenate---cysteine ligase (CTP)